MSHKIIIYAQSFNFHYYCCYFIVVTVVLCQCGQGQGLSDYI